MSREFTFKRKHSVFIYIFEIFQMRFQSNFFLQDSLECYCLLEC